MIALRFITWMLMLPVAGMLLCVILCFVSVPYMFWVAFTSLPHERMKDKYMPWYLPYCILKYIQGENRYDRQTVAAVEASQRRDTTDFTDSLLESQKRKIDELTAQLAASEKKREDLEKTLDMYANAWHREVSMVYKPKMYEIDALVLATRALAEKANASNGPTVQSTIATKKSP